MKNPSGKKTKSTRPTAMNTGTGRGKKDAAAPSIQKCLRFLRGLFLTLLLLWVNIWFERTTVGKHLEVMTYNLLQSRLSATNRAEELPVVIVDISGLNATLLQHTSDTPVTLREPLLRLLTAIATKEPRAIGVDLDFAPERGIYVTPSDPDFFQSCLRLKAGTEVPIFLGVFRSQALPPQAWLGDQRYEQLATSIMVPRDSKKMVQWLRVGEGSTPLPTMSAALADAFRHAERRPPKWLRWLVMSVREKSLAPSLTISEFLVDYSPLEAIEQIPTIEGDLPPNLSERMTDRIVLIGDVKKSYDTFVVPDRKEPVPGVLVHACAAITLIQGPLYQWTSGGRVAIDLILFVLAFGSVALLNMYFHSRTTSSVDTERLQIIAARLIGLLVAVGAGCVLVQMYRLIWDDFIFVAAAVLFHPAAERYFGKLVVSWPILKAWCARFIAVDKKGHSE